MSLIASGENTWQSFREGLPREPSTPKLRSLPGMIYGSLIFLTSRVLGSRGTQHVVIHETANREEGLLCLHSETQM